MKANELKGQELRDKVRDLYDELSERVYEIEKSGYYLNKSAASRFRNLPNKYPDNIELMNEKELLSLYRELKSIDDLKSSTLEGAEEAYNMYKDIEDIVENLSPRMKEKFWDLYDKIYSVNKNLGTTYKYDVLNEIATMIHKSKNKTETFNELENNLIRVAELVSGDITFKDALDIVQGKKSKFETETFNTRYRMKLSDMFE